MANTIDMQSMRQINLFNKICRVQTKDFFTYNNTLFFGVPKAKVSQAIGKDATNIKKLSKILRKKIKVIEMPQKNTSEEVKRFVSSLLDSVEINNIEVNNDSIEINATRMNRAAIIGRNRSREKELSSILKNKFGINNINIS